MVQVYDEQTETNGYHVNNDPPESLFDAPDFATFLKKNISNQSREYERKAQMFMKTFMIASLNNRQYADAAAFIKFGPGFSRASGELCDANKSAREFVDMLTAPSNPYILFGMMALPLVSQLFRNHEPEMQNVKMSWRNRRNMKKTRQDLGVKVPKPPAKELFTLKFGKRRIPIKLGIRLPKINGFVRIPTQHPQELVTEIFSDPEVIKALQKMGIYAQRPEHQSDDAEENG